MVKVSVYLLAVGLVGCANSVTYVIPSRPDNVATLEFVKPADSKAYPFASGIYHIDDSVYLFGRPHADSVFLAPGRHEIGVNCKKFVGTDEQPSLIFKFEAGVRYKLTCQDDEPVIRAASDHGA